MSLIFGQALFGWPRRFPESSSLLSAPAQLSYLQALGMILTQPSQLTANMYHYIIVGGGWLQAGVYFFVIWF